MNRHVRTTPEADDQVRIIHGWWRQHRTAVPTLFLDELEAALSLIGRASDVGHSYRRSPVVGTRRVLLPGPRYHVYYVQREGVVLVLAVWHAKGGSGPPLRLLQLLRWTSRAPRGWSRRCDSDLADSQVPVVDELDQ